MSSSWPDCIQLNLYDALTTVSAEAGRARDRSHGYGVICFSIVQVNWLTRNDGGESAGLHHQVLSETEINYQ